MDLDDWEKGVDISVAAIGHAQLVVSSVRPGKCDRRADGPE